MNSIEIREKFLKFFENYHHERVASSSLIPAADPTLLFTNAGMVQFKDVFLGVSNPGYKRATTAQKCVRAGGKHNDLENVGFTPRHHTFFEMLGNFSFGDYFKKEAIAFAWELLTRHYSLPTDKLWVTVYEKDDEAFELWEKMGVPKNRIGRLGEKDNFWAMGDTGPCGPCTEIHFDWGEKYGCGKPHCAPGCSCETRFLEIWNLVFMQFNRDSSGKMEPLPKPSVDTGAGLERLASVLQSAYSNYSTDLFQPLLHAIGKKVGRTYGDKKDDDIAFRVLADHLRSCTFLLSDGVTPSNEGRGYVLRRILRRAIRYGKKLGQEKPFLFELVSAVNQSLGSIYPELQKNKKVVEVMMKEEEDKFHETLHRGMGLLDESIKKTAKSGGTNLSGEIAFKLYDTFGFPIDLIEVVCREHKLGIDHATFDKHMEQQRAQSQGSRGGQDLFFEKIEKAMEKTPETSFVGYESLEGTGKILALFSTSGERLKELAKGQSGYTIFDQTPFYAESGGQVGDTGRLKTKSGEARVENTKKLSKRFLHQITVSSGSIEEGKTATLEVNSVQRKRTAIHHTATHMLHASLRNKLGERVKQAGSLVDSERLRFDFTFPRALTPEEIDAIENDVNQEIQKGTSVSVKEMAYDQAIQSGALAFFDEKYGSKVRVVRVGDKDGAFSVELCGGTHLSTISDLGMIQITSESSVASGVRRIEAVAGPKALEHLKTRSDTLFRMEEVLGVKGVQLFQKVETLVQQNKTLRQEIDSLKLKLAGSTSQTQKTREPETFGSLHAFIEEISVGDGKVLRSLVDQIRDKNPTHSLVCLATREGGKVALCIGLTKDIVGKFDAGKLVKLISGEVSGSGGGRPDFAQAGGANPEGIPRAFEKLRSWLKDNC